MVFDSVNAQNLDGKWILKEIDSGNGEKGYPGFQLLEINNGDVDIYTDFSLKERLTKLKMLNKNCLNNNEIVPQYEIINKNHIKWFINGKSNDKEVVFACDFHRLEPTITNLRKEDMEQMTFVFTTKNGRESEFKFNEELWDKETLKLLKVKEGEKKIIEKIDSTFFVSTYNYGQRKVSFPIKEITSEFLKLYLIPTIQTELIAYRKK